MKVFEIHKGEAGGSERIYFSIGTLNMRSRLGRAISQMTEPDRLPPPPFWTTQYFSMMVMARPDRRMIDPILIKSVLNAPVRKEREANGRIRRWGWIPELKHLLRVVTLADGETVHNAMLDRDFEP